MNCYDCATTTGTTAAAVAICHDCGAGVCADHATNESRQLARMVPLGRHIPVEPAARIIRCPTCSAAVAAVQAVGGGVNS